jgi:hypothetical protein
MSGRTVLFTAFALGLAVPASAGTVQHVTAEHPSLALGHATAVTVTGTNPCGAAHINWGDGTAITYAITGLPTTQSHTYAKADRYMIVARGMGNCDGDASTTVEITGPPPPEPTRGSIGSVQVSPSPAIVRQPVTIAVDGRSPCSFVIEYGDGNKQDFSGGLPKRVTHSYARADRYMIVARGMGNCDGEPSTIVEITDPRPPRPPEPTAGSIKTVQFSPSPAIVRQPVTFAVDGRGPCSFVVDYGDGNQQDFSGVLPKRIEHTYGVAGTYRVIVGPVAPCTGKFTETLNVLARGGTSIRGITVTPAPAEARQSVTITVIGSGTCGYTIAFGDGNTEERTKPLPDRVAHVYSAADTYTITVQATSGCTGSARRALTVFGSLIPHP